jgi:hypothetical protein
MVKELAEMKKEYEKVEDAMNSVKMKGYGVVNPGLSDITLEEPVLIKHGNKYGVKMKAVEAGVDIKTGKPKPKDVLKQDQSKVFADLMNDTGKGKGKKEKGAKSDNIVSGGSKMTHITVNIQKLQDDTKIFVESTEKGIEQLGEKVQEIILRAVNSVNQMQT